MDDALPFFSGVTGAIEIGRGRKKDPEINHKEIEALGTSWFRHSCHPVNAAALDGFPGIDAGGAAARSSYSNGDERRQT
jgi:hypothetical protein